MGSGSVKVYSHEGKYIRSVGSFGTVLGHFVRPKGIDIDQEGNIYVVDATFQNVQIFDKNGNLLLFFGGNETGKQGDMYLPADIAISYETEKFQQYVDPDYDLQYVIFVMNQFGPYKLSVYGRVERKS
jgi:DNA-binding beta-propeller fold protein YncE